MSSSSGRGRVLVVLHEESPGGASISLMRCLPGLEERGWEFSFFVPRPGKLFDELRERGYRVSGAPRTIVYSLRALRLDPGPLRRLRGIPPHLMELRRTLRGERPVLVHANSHTTLADAALARATGVPTVFHIHEMIRGGVKAGLTRRAIRLAGTEVVAVSNACADGLSLKAFRPRVVYGGAPIPREAASIRDRSPTVVGTIGVLSRRKGTDLFVEAARLLSSRRTDIEFVLAGAASDPLDSSFAARTLAEAKAAGVVHAERIDTQRELRNWDVFVLPSRTDPFPIVMLEAMAAGLPVIAADADGLPEQVGDAGRLVPAGDAGALAREIEAVADAPRAQREAMGAAARERVREMFTIERQVEGLDRAYLDAVGAEG